MNITVNIFDFAAINTNVELFNYIIFLWLVLFLTQLIYTFFCIFQIYSISALLLLYFTVLLLSAQIIGLTLMICCAVSLPLGLQFMILSLFCITTLAFKIMY